MNKFITSSALALATLYSAASFASLPAANVTNQGFSGPTQVSSVKQVLDSGMFSDDTPVTLEGHITASLGGEMYRFADDTGSVNIEIEHDKWLGLEVTPASKVIIQGEIDKELQDVMVDVSQIQLAK
ncbi:NirD/YgiW/YdeI family stress tolerance protein [Shewanella sp. SNU WT4]|uniref:YgiW/YdeI family stress tolerance OB fold protein n=1 Tax=Shewanella sp. SNU WT4 TaxID=2590015 RepID=UPI00112722FC|nr:NirD/YgiW/YdeI family stress tolerance protein [Shewanella sp. SNU WT4]QDF66199.1 NirD/YgiW/YdeI family stress tolerance protein [Shewanella sp. SNU WT4]